MVNTPSNWDDPRFIVGGTDQPLKIGEEKYRKISVIEIPDAGQRNAAREKIQQWVYFPPDTETTPHGHVDLEVDRVRRDRPGANKVVA